MFYVHQSDNVALTFYLFSSPDAVERDRMHFTPKTYKDEPMVLLTVTGISILDLL